MDSKLSKLIIITGANKGIGYGLLQQLAKQSDSFKFIIGVRSLENGTTARDELSKTIPNIKDRLEVQQLDISDSVSIDDFVAWVAKQYGKVDLLVNNAGILIKTYVDADMVATTFKTNYWGTVELTEKMKPLLNDDGKIINIASNLGRLTSIKSSDLQQELLSETIDQERLHTLVKKFHEDVANDTAHKNGWLGTRNWPAYSLSKVFLNIYTRILARDEDIVKRNIQVYSCSPGWVRTDMGGSEAFKSLEEGVVTPQYLVNLPWSIDEKLQGQFFIDSEVTPLL